MVQQQQCKPQEKKIESRDWGDKARTNAEECVAGGLPKKQLVDTKVPSGQMFRQAEQAHQCGDARRHLSPELPGHVLFAQQPQRNAEQSQTNGRIHFDNGLTGYRAL